MLLRWWARPIEDTSPISYWNKCLRDLKCRYNLSRLWSQKLSDPAGGKLTLLTLVHIAQMVHGRFSLEQRVYGPRLQMWLECGESAVDWYGNVLYRGVAHMREWRGTALFAIDTDYGVWYFANGIFYLTVETFSYTRAIRTASGKVFKKQIA